MCRLNLTKSVQKFIDKTSLLTPYPLTSSFIRAEKIKSILKATQRFAAAADFAVMHEGGPNIEGCAV